MPAREFDQAQTLTEPSQGSGLDTLEQSRPGQDVVKVVWEPREPIVEVVVVAVVEKARLGSAVDPQGVESVAPNPLGVRLCRASGYVHPPIKQATPASLYQASGATVWSPREHQELATNDNCGEDQPERGRQGLARRLAGIPMGAHCGNNQQDHTAGCHYFHWPPDQSDDKTHDC
jgi:hypothetical protein